MSVSPQPCIFIIITLPILSVLFAGCKRTCNALSIITLLSIAILLPQQAFTQFNPPSTDTRQRILATYQLVKDSLLTLPVQPFTVSNADYSIADFEAVRLQIWKGNLQQVRAYLLRAFNSEEIEHENELYVSAKSVWVDYLLAVDSFALSYSEASQLVFFADSANVTNTGLAYLALARASSYISETYAHAYKNVQKILDIAAATGDVRLEGGAQLIAGALARKFFYGVSGRSIPYYDKAIAAAKRARDTPVIIRSLILKQDDLAQAGKLEKGLPFFDEAVQIAIRSKNLKFTSNICESVFSKLNAIDEMDKSVEMLLYALDATKRFGMTRTEAHMYIQLSGVYASRHLYDSSLYYINQCTTSPNIAPGTLTPQFIKANVYYDMGRYQQAAELYHAGIDDYIKSYIVHGQDELNRWETTLRTQEKEAEIQGNTARRKQLIWIISGIAAILFISLLALFWQRSLRRRLAAQNRLISRQSQKLEQSLAEKEILLKEIHHRVKNNLQVIGSLLDMHQGNIHQPEQQEEAFTKARMHVHTIAMIHQNLYEQQQVAAVNMYTFVNELFTQTERLFNKHDKPYLFTNRIADTYLDIDTAVPLGLILNELLTNAFKYVLPMVSKMELTIHIAPGSEPEKYILQYQDNGSGLPGGVIPVQDNSLGLQLVKQLSRQIGGRLSYRFEEGSHFTISFLTLKGRKEMD